MAMSRTALAGLVVAVAVAACGGATGGAPARTPYPLPPGAVAVALPTQAPFTGPLPSTEFGCELMGPGHVLVVWDQAAHSISFAFDQWTADQGSTTILWPRGFSAREYQSRLELLDPSGLVLARDGEEVSGVLGLDPEHVCMVRGKVYPPAG
jgi:hypothetical protein